MYRDISFCVESLSASTGVPSSEITLNPAPTSGADDFGMNAMAIACDPEDPCSCGGNALTCEVDD